MPRGGARNRSGPQPDENSLKSAKIGYQLTALPSEGYDGDVPVFPLPDASDRELELWAWAWTTPQACAWSIQLWRIHTIAMWVRTAVVCETESATAADKNSLHRFADQIGFTPAGLKENGWKISTDQVAARRDARQPEAETRRTSARDRLKAISGGKGA